MTAGNGHTWEQRGHVRVVGYVREAPGPQDGPTAYSQSEAIRRWVAETGHQLVAVCQDARQVGHALGREGYRALLGIIGAGQVDAVIVATLEALAADKIVQEVMLWDVRSRGVTVLSAAEADIADLKDPPADRTRLLIRDVLARVTEYEMAARLDRPPMIIVEEAPADVVVELLPSEDPGSGEQSRAVLQ